MVTLDDITAARERVGKKLHRTPMARSTSLGSQTGTRLHFKLEMFQKTGSFKVRGVLNKLQHLTADEKARGVISMSSGNHAQALAYGATLSGIASTVVMPSWSIASKVEATRSYGAEVVLTGGDLMEVCDTLREERNLVLVHPFDDPLIIAGAGTLGLEILDDVASPDTVPVSIGGGGLISGIATAIKLRGVPTRVIGVEPRGASAMSQSLERGSPVHLKEVRTIADGLAAPFAGEHTLSHVQRYVDEVLLVSDEEITRALEIILDRCKVVAEPAAAAAFAPLLFGRVHLPSEATVVVVLCGGNIDSRRLAQLLG